MYESFYQLRERPFALSPDPEYLFLSRVHREALDYLRYGIESQAGFVVITGEIGSGKTTLLQTALSRLGDATVARIVNTHLEPHELVESVMIDLGLDPVGKSRPVVLRDLGQYLVDQRLAGRLVLLVIDEAQNLSLAALEEIRMLTNFETEKAKLLQVVLVGQPNLRDKLASPELEQFRQRITVSYHLGSLEPGETHAYINHRLRRASLGPAVEFPVEATGLVHERSAGVPRIINVICDATLVFGYAEERRTIDRALVEAALQELDSTGVLARERGRQAVVPAETSQIRVKPDPRGAPAVYGQGLHGSQAGAEVPAHMARAATADLLRFQGPELETLRAREAQIAQRERQLSERDRQLSERDRQLAERDRRLDERERQLREQKRVMAQEYVLLRGRQPSSGAVTSSGRARRPVPEGRWFRFKRWFFGVPVPVLSSVDK
jgi:putative secretion ATPase (PEP-CTERM system associated)